MRLPDFFIIGASRSGTNSLRVTLSGHPEICGPLRRETHFFDRNYYRGLDFYKSCFPEGNCLTFDSTPNYLYSPKVPERIRKDMPKKSHRFILLLRNPIDRAWSNFWHWRTTNCIDESQLRQPGSELLDRGLYAKHLKRWLKVFDLENFFIARAEDFFENGPEVANRIVQEHLNLPGSIEHAPYCDPKRSVPNAKTAYPGPEHHTLNFLKNYYRPHNEELYELLGVNFMWED